MGDQKVIDTTPLNMVEVKQQLNAIKKRDGELNFRANKTEEYLQTVVDLKVEDMKTLKKALEGLDIPRLKPEHISKIIDILPQTPEEVKTVLQGFSLSLTKEQQKQISDEVSKL